jgi:uncharacterized protein YndB with AHSA1/START domain/uncharacterized damage-inducible protein DinB
MPTSKTAVKLTSIINASPQQVLDSFQHECRLREWLCDVARTQPRKGGLFEVHWNSGYEARSVFTALKPPGTIAFTWLGIGEPGETSVRVTLKLVEGGTKVTLVHSGFGTGKRWAGRAEEFEREWNDGLDNLKSVLETGLDLREARQPRLGLGWEDAPDGTGVLVNVVIEGGPCERAGLQVGDVIVRAGDRKVRSDPDWMQAFYSWRAGQRVPFTVMRAGKRLRLVAELGQRPVPDVPDDPAVLVEQVRQAHEKSIAALRASVLLLTDEQSGRAPAEGEWSVKQVLAHLCASEQGLRSRFTDVLLGNESHGVEARLPEQFAAILTGSFTAGALLDRLERELAESRAFVAALTPEHRTNKWRYRQIAQALLNFAWHTGYHIGQVQATVEKIKS